MRFQASAADRVMRDSGTDRALGVTVPAAWAEIVGAALMDLFGPFEEEALDGRDPEGDLTLVFYPDPEAEVTSDAILAVLPPQIAGSVSGAVRIEARSVSRDWVEGWRAHFRPVVVGAVRIRPPWESPNDSSDSLADVVINPGLGFGTGLHPTTRGVLDLLQRGAEGGKRPYPLPNRWGRHSRGPLVDAGTGSGVLAVAAAKLGWRPIVAFDNDSAALPSARENIAANGVDDLIEVHELAVSEAPAGWFDGATVLANMTLEPVLILLRKLGPGKARRGRGSDLGDAVRAGKFPSPIRLVVSGILAGAQERQVHGLARQSGFVLAGEVREDDWVSIELVPTGSGG